MLLIKILPCLKMRLKVEGLDYKLTETFVKFCLDRLPANPNYIEIVGQDTLVNGKSGLCIDIDEDNFLILVSKESKSLSQIYISIAHELVHVKQFMYDNLGTLLDQGYEYDTCWWEQEARERSERFLLEFVKYFKLKG